MFARPCLKFFLLFPKFKPLSWNFACRLSSSGNFLAFHWQGFKMDQPICRVWLGLDKCVCLEFKSHCSEYPTWLRYSIEKSCGSLPWVRRLKFIKNQLWCEGFVFCWKAAHIYPMHKSLKSLRLNAFSRQCLLSIYIQYWMSAAQGCRRCKFFPAMINSNSKVHKISITKNEMKWSWMRKGKGYRGVGSRRERRTESRIESRTEWKGCLQEQVEVGM